MRVEGLRCKQYLRKMLKLNQRVLCIFDNFKVQCTDRLLQLLESNNIVTAFLPLNCTGELAK